MRKFFLSLIAVALVAAACGDTGSVGTEASPGSVATPTSAGSPSSTAADGSQASTTPAPTAGTPSTEQPPAPTTSLAAVTTNFDGDPAPDFVLALENRAADFRLSEEQKPVYMVFWAEW